jgi:ABC-2 type transport system permease protein
MIAGDTIALTQRSLKKWMRNPFAVMAGAIQGIFWLALFGNSFNLNNVFASSIGGTTSSFVQQAFGGAPNYITFLAPGIICLVALMSMSYMGVDMVFDKVNGYIDEVSSYPIRRSSIYFGGVLQSIAKSMVLAPITFVLALIVPDGMKLVPGFGILNLVGIFAAIILLVAVFSTIFSALSISVKSVDSFFAIVNFLALPITFVSTTLFPIGFFPTWLKPIAKGNPISLASNAARLLILNKTLTASQLSSFTGDIVGLGVFLVMFATLGILMARNALKAR